MSKKILCVSLGYEGGCVYYANQLLNHFPTDKIDVWIAASTEEPFCGKAKKIKVYKGLIGQLWSWTFFLPYYLLLLLLKIWRGRLIGCWCLDLTIGIQSLCLYVSGARYPLF